MRVLVTGGSGQVGGALLKHLTALGSVVALGRDEFDLARPDRLPAELDRVAPGLIVNAAAYTAVDRAEDDSEIAFRVNAEAPGVIARWAAGRKVPLIHFSTDYVFDGSGTRPWREEDAPGPLSVYGASKLAGDEAVRAARGAHLIIRTSWVYAAKGTNFLRSILRLAKERTELRIVADQFGAPSSARLIAHAVASIIGAGGADLADRFAAAQGIVNVAASGETSWHGFAVAIIEGLKARGVPLAVERVVPIETQQYPTKAKRPANSRFDILRLSQVFGIVTPRWDQALELELGLVADEFSQTYVRPPDIG
jgi:dTDP-4-dehydrorhamnose reductase